MSLYTEKPIDISHIKITANSITTFETITVMLMSLNPEISKLILTAELDIYTTQIICKFKNSFEKCYKIKLPHDFNDFHIVKVNEKINRLVAANKCFRFIIEGEDFNIELNKPPIDNSTIAEKA